MADWTIVPPKKGRRKAGNISESVQKHDPRDVIDTSATVETLKRHLDRAAAEWKALDLMPSVRKTIKNLHVEDGPKITKAVCMGVGILATNNVENRSRSLLQLVAFLDIVKHLEVIHGGEVKLYMQEPRLCELDKQFLSSLDIEVLEWPRPVAPPSLKTLPTLGPVERMLDNGTFVADFFVEWSITAAFAEHDLPLLLTIWPDVAKVAGHVFKTDQHFKMAKRIANSYQCYKFPLKGDEPIALSTLYLCCLKDGVEQEEKVTDNDHSRSKD